MAWARVQSKSIAALSGSTTTSVTLSSTPTTGNKIIAWTCNTAPATSSISNVHDGAATNLTQLSVFTNAGNVTNGLFFYDVPATPQSTITVTFSATAGDRGLIVQEISGLLAGNTTACVDGTIGTLTGGSTPTGSPTYSSAAANEFLIACFADFGNSATVTVPSGMTGDANNVNTNSGDDILIAYGNSTGGSEATSWTYTPTSGDQWAACTVAFKLAAGGTTSLPELVMAPRIAT